MIRRIPGYLFLFWASWSLGQLTNLSLHWPSVVPVPVYVHDILVVAILGWWITQEAYREQLRDAVGSLPGWLVLALGASLCWSIMLSQTFTPLLYALRLTLYLAFIRLHHYHWSTHPKTGLGLVSTAGGLMLILGWLQYLTLPDTRWLAVLGLDDHYYRLIGPLLDPNFTGLIGVFLIIITSAVSYWGVAIAATLTVGTTFSRASFLSLLTSLIVFIWRSPTADRSRRARMAAVLLCILMSAVWLAPKPGGEGVALTRTSTINARLGQYSALTQQWQTQPVTFLIGRGLFSPKGKADSSLGISNRATQPDSSMLLVLEFFGLAGVLVLLWHMPDLVRLLVRAGPTQQALLAALVVHSGFNNSLLEPFTLLWFWSLWGLLDLSEKNELSALQ